MSAFETGSMDSGAETTTPTAESAMRLDRPTLDPSRDGALVQATVAIGWATALSGAGLIAAPRLAMRILGATPTEPADFFFRIIGMFMVVSGGTLAQGAPAGEAGVVARRWSVAAKAGAATAVTTGVLRGRFGKQALALAAFDAGAAALIAAAESQSDAHREAR